MQLSQLMLPFNLIGRSRRVATDISYGPSDAMKLDIFRPRKAHSEALPVIIFWHGGSWNGGSKDRYAFMGAALAQMGCVAIIAEYRKYPEIRFPQFSLDAAEVVRWASTHIHEYKGDPSHLFVMGHSAGAHTAASIAYQPEYLENVSPTPRVAGFIGLAGPYNFMPRSNLRAIFPIEDPTKPWQIHPTQTSHIPALLLHGRIDWVVGYFMSTRFSQALKATDTPVELHLYSLLEHFSLVVVYLLPFRLLPGPWRRTRNFMHRQSQDSQPT